MSNVICETLWYRLHLSIVAVQYSAWLVALCGSYARQFEANSVTYSSSIIAIVAMCIGILLTPMICNPLKSRLLLAHLAFAGLGSILGVCGLLWVLSQM